MFDELSNPFLAEGFHEAHTSTPQRPVVVPQTVQPVHINNNNTFTDKVIAKFSGYMHEDSQKFIQDFESYCVLTNMDHRTEPAKAIVAFRVHLQGPARVWFDTASDKSTLTGVKAQFMKEYCVSDDNTKYMSETTAFDQLTLRPGQPLEDFHSIILEKGTLLHKMPET